MKRSRFLGLLVFLVKNSPLYLGLWGVFQCLKKGGQDFSVFYYAGALIKHGQEHLLYRGLGPDVYLYAPGFAWLIYPFTYLDQMSALVLWNGLKLILLFFLVKDFSKCFGFIATGLAFLALARPLLIDFQYGQINFFVFSSMWFLFRSLTEKQNRFLYFVKGFWSGILMAIKLLSAPISLILFFSFKRPRVKIAFMGIVFGVFCVFLLPLLSQRDSQSKADTLFIKGWIEALQKKGVPEDSHNQSFSAGLARWFSGNPVHMIVLGPPKGEVLGPVVALTQTQRHKISLIWIVLSCLYLIGMAYRFSKTRNFVLGCLFISSVILPLHLIWKPYFIWGLPCVALLFSKFYGGTRTVRILGGLLGLVLGLTNKDVIGPRWAGLFESISGFLWIHLIVLGLVGYLYVKQTKNRILQYS